MPLYVIILLSLFAILLLIAILAVVPVRLTVDFRGDYNKTIIYVRYLFLKFSLGYTDKPGKNNRSGGRFFLKPTMNKKRAKAVESETGDLKKINLKALYNDYLPIIKYAPEAVYRLIESIKFTNINICWYIGGRDAAHIAISTGCVAAAFYSAVALVTPPFVFRFNSVNFIPDFGGEGAKGNRASVIIKGRVYVLIRIGLWVIAKLNANRTTNKTGKKNNFHGEQK